jgi:hypothetical protein
MKIKTALLAVLAGLLASAGRADIVTTTTFSNTGFTVDTSTDLILKVPATKTGNVSLPIPSFTDGIAGTTPGLDATIGNGAF